MATISVYQITQEEREMVEAFNELQENILLIVCDLEGLGCCVIVEDLNHQEFKLWRDQFDTTLRAESVKQYDPDSVTP